MRPYSVTDLLPTRSQSNVLFPLSVHPDTVPAMYRAVLREARTDRTFRAKVEASARRILTAKQRQGLLTH